MKNLTAKAYLFALVAHKGQFRKYTHAPYITHCENVAKIVESVGGSKEMIAAAYLHDTLEDQPDRVTFEILEEEFGQLVALYVRSLTDVYTKELCPTLNRATRKFLEARRFCMEPNQVKTIKLADLIDNTSSIVKHDPNFAKVYLKEKEEMLKYLVGGNTELYERAKLQIV